MSENLLVEILRKKDNEWDILKKPCPMCGYTNPRMAKERTH